MNTTNDRRTVVSDPVRVVRDKKVITLENISDGVRSGLGPAPQDLLLIFYELCEIKY